MSSQGHKIGDENQSVYYSRTIFVIFDKCQDPQEEWQ